MKLRTKLTGLVVGVTTVVLAVPAFALAAIPNSSTGQINACRLNLTGVIRIIDAQNGANCIVGETSLNWAQSGGDYFKASATDTLTADSNGIVTHAPAVFNVNCGTTQVALYGVLKATGTGVLYVVGFDGINKEGDFTSLSSMTDTTGSGYTIGIYSGVPNLNVSLTYYVLCSPVPSIPS